MRGARGRGRALAARARRRLQRLDDPIRADAALRLPRPGAPRQARRHRAVPGARPLLRRLPARRRAARRARGARLRGPADPHRAGLPAPDADLPPRRLPPVLRRQVPRVQRRLAGRRRLHRHPLRGARRLDRPRARAPGVRHGLHADPPRADRHAARRLRARARAPSRPARAPAPGADRLGGLAERPRVPHHLRRRRRGRPGGHARHARRARLRRHDADRAGRAGAARLPPRAARGPRPVRPGRRRARRARLRRQPVPRAGGQQQEALRALPGPALQPPDRGRGGRRDRRDDPVDADPAPRRASTTATG